MKQNDELDVVVPYGKEPARVIGHKLRGFRKTGRVFTDARGRRFTFGKGEDGDGARYYPQFKGNASE